MNIEILDSYLLNSIGFSQNTVATSLILLAEIPESFPFFKSFACSYPSHTPSYDSPSYFFPFSYFLPRTHAYYLIQSNDNTIITYQISSILPDWNHFVVYNFFCCEFFTSHYPQISLAKFFLVLPKEPLPLWYQKWWQGLRPTYMRIFFTLPSPSHIGFN